MIVLIISTVFKLCDSMIFSFKLCSPLQIPEDQWCLTSEQTEQKTKLTGKDERSALQAAEETQIGVWDE